MAADRKQKQITITAIIGLILVLALGFMAWLFSPSKQGALTGLSQPVIDTTIIQDRTSGASPEATWVSQSRVAIERIRQENEELVNSVANLRKTISGQNLALEEAVASQLEQQVLKIAELEAKLALFKSPPTDTAASNRTIGSASNPASLIQTGASVPYVPNATNPKDGSDFIRRNNTVTPVAPRVEPSNGVVRGMVTNFTLAPTAVAGAGAGIGETVGKVVGARAPKRKNVGSYIPAGSYVQAVVLSGADASTNVASRDNPIPVIVKITGKVVTPGGAGFKGAKINLEGCTVTGSATGDLSSERVKVRLIQMSCVNRKGEVLETAVSGYISGSGKEGVRGHVVSREGNLVSNAAIAGALAGLGESVSGGNAAISGSEGLSSADIIKQAGLSSVGGGIGSAANTLSEYYISRAEQYQPIVSLYGGTDVELVFLKGVDLQ